MKRLAILVVLLLGLGPAGCASVPEEEILPPKINLSDLRILESSGFEQELEVDLRVSNPNNFDIDLEGLSFALEVMIGPLDGYVMHSSGREFPLRSP